MKLSFFPSAEQLRMKSGKTMVALCGCRGIANICRSNRQEGTKWGNCLQPVVLPDLQGKGPRAQKKHFC
jgi:hypothetical protein